MKGENSGFQFLESKNKRRDDSRIWTVDGKIIQTTYFSSIEEFHHLFGDYLYKIGKKIGIQDITIISAR